MNQVDNPQGNQEAPNSTGTAAAGYNPQGNLEAPNSTGTAAAGYNPQGNQEAPNSTGTVAAGYNPQGNQEAPNSTGTAAAGYNSQGNQEAPNSTVTAPAGPATFPGSGVYRVNKDPSSWFVVPLGVSFRNLCRVAGLVYSEGARMRQVLDQVAVEGGARDLEYEVVSRFSFREFPVALVKGGDGQRLRVLHGRAGPIVGLVGLEGCENVDLLRQRVQHLEQHAPVGIVTGVCVQNVPDDTSTPYGDLRWTPIGFFGLQEIAPEISVEVISILITNVPHSASEKNLEDALTSAGINFVGKVTLPRGKRRDRNLGRATVWMSPGEAETAVNSNINLLGRTLSLRHGE